MKKLIAMLLLSAVFSATAMVQGSIATQLKASEAVEAPKTKASAAKVKAPVVKASQAK